MSAITWSKIWEDYRAAEEERWREHYTSRGFDTWSAWRREYVADFGLEKRQWTLESLANPLASVPTFFVGAYKGWAQYYQTGKTVATFADIARHPALRENSGVHYALAHPPEETRLIMFRCGGDTVVRDGTHRCAAMALSAAAGQPYHGAVQIAVAHFDPSERELFLHSFDQRFAKTIKQ